MDPLEAWLEAWSRWFEGDPTLRESVLWGLKILWWGRIGKLAAFLAGLVIILDIVEAIIGPERLRRVTERSGERLRNEDSGLQTLYAAVVGIIVLGLATWAAILHPYNSSDELPGEPSTNPWFVLILVSGAGIAFLMWLLINKSLIWVFEHNRVAWAVRVISLVLFVFGFSFDMLAS